MSKYTVEVTKSPQQQGPAKRWWLDFPATNQHVTLAELTETGLVFQGWVLLAGPATVKVYLKQDGATALFDLNKSRPDVVEVILKQPGTNHPQRDCGFRFNVKMSAADFELGLVDGTTEYVLCRGHIAGQFKVLQGRENWLFLDNDTNKSVEQHTGKLLLEPEQLEQWQQYLEYLARQNTEMPTAMLVAPSKEHVYPQFYPFAKAQVTPVDQFSALKQVAETVINPVTRLQQTERRSFRVTDTHWSPYGACVATMLVAERFGIKDVASCFAADAFKTYQVAGDLGNKLFPPQRHEEEFLSGFSYRPNVIYDNGLPNFGRVMIMSFAQAKVTGHLLLFGSSSAYSMLDYLVRVFSKVTMVHTAGNVDTEVVATLKPDYLLTQTNARFIVRAPVVGYSLAGVMAEKLAAADIDDAKLLQHSANQTEQSNDSSAQYFHHLLTRAARGD